MGQTLQPNQRLDGYVIDKLIGKGGMGEVYRARQVSLNRLVALKVLPPSIAQRDPDFARRFVDEARAAGRLNHPNIIAVFDVGKTTIPNGQAGKSELNYFSMEYVRGRSVKDILSRKGPLPVKHVAHIMSSLGKALRYAESQGIVHRDIKPDNIMVTNEGEVKLADLGLALRLDHEPQVDKDGNPIREGVMGTPLYMSPEQAKGLVVDCRSDQYSLGATMFHMLTGQPPYNGETSRDILRAHVCAPVPDPGSINRSIPEVWRKLCVKMMSKAPEDRYATNKDMRDAIIAAIQGAENGGESKSRNSTKNQRLRLTSPVWTVYLPYGIGIVATVFIISMLLTWDNGGAPTRRPEASNKSQSLARSETIRDQLARLPAEHAQALVELRKLLADSARLSAADRSLIDGEIATRERLMTEKNQPPTPRDKPKAPTTAAPELAIGPLRVSAPLKRNGHQIELAYGTKESPWMTEDFIGGNVTNEKNALTWATSTQGQPADNTASAAYPTLRWRGWLLPPFTMAADVQIEPGTSRLYIGVQAATAKTCAIFSVIDNTERKNTCSFWPYTQPHGMEPSHHLEFKRSVPYNTNLVISLSIRVDEQGIATLSINDKRMTSSAAFPIGVGLSPIFVVGRTEAGDTTLVLRRLSITGSEIQQPRPLANP